MAWSATGSFIPAASIVLAMQKGFAASAAWDVGADDWYVALFNDTVVPSLATSPCKYGAAPWNANEVNHGGAPWPAGGVTMTATPANFSIANYSSGEGVMLDCSDNISVASTTMTNAHGCIIYNHTLSSDYPIIAAIDFTANYSTNNGTFAITWDTNGIWRIDLHP